MIRAFIAIELTDAARKEVVAIQEKLIASGADVKWVSPENIHLTLKFLGNIGEEKLEEVKAALTKAASGVAEFGLTLREIGAFPDMNCPCVIWVSADEGSGNLAELIRQLEDELAPLGFAKESRKWSPHLTLGRARSPKNREKLKKIISHLGTGTRGPVIWQVKEALLFKSELTQRGPVYAALFKAPLNA